MSNKQQKQGPKNKSGKAKRKPAGSGAASPQTRKRSKRPGLKALAVILSLGAVTFAGATVYQDHWEKMTDLSVIGNGTPTVVQVHDPACKLCSALKSNTETALRPHDETIRYRIADINTAKGRSFASKHGVRHVTLVTFTGAGKVVSKLNGVKEPDELSPYFERLAKQSRNRPQ